MEFNIKLADRVIGIKSIYNYIRKYCEGYVCEDPADFSVEITQADLDFEREKSARDDIAEGRAVINHHDAYLETLAVYRKIVEKMMDYDCLLFHGSSIAVDGVAYLFTAKSGTGKSTHSSYWRETFGDRAVMVNDDKPLLKLTDKGVMVCGTPWNGKHNLGCNMVAPLQAICILERGEKNEIEEISAKDALPMLLQQSHRPGNPMAMLTYMNIMDRLTKNLKFYRMKCTLDPEAARMAHEAMRPK